MEGTKEKLVETHGESGLPPLLLTDRQAAAMLGIGTSYFRRLIKSGDIAPIPVELGRRRLHRRDLLERWVEMGLPHRLSPEWKSIDHGNADQASLLESKCGGDGA